MRLVLLRLPEIIHVLRNGRRLSGGYTLVDWKLPLDDVVLSPHIIVGR